ncbi:NAD(P)/FAD-dependent oxidoreductase [bacterium]|nr:MAG: NAD(P)/FAD-dependent oxidoreductase [bacterium]
MNNIYDVTIIGAGPAGITAAIQLKRFAISFVIIEKESAGGLLKNAGVIENYPGFPDGITGNELICLFNNHLTKYNIKVEKEVALSVDFADELYSVETDRREILSKYIIIASGTKPKNYIVNGLEPECIFYDVFKLPYEGLAKSVAVIGGGDAAFDYALNLHSRGYKIFILNRAGMPKCIKTLWEKYLLQTGITYLRNAIVDNITHGDNRYIVEYLDCTLSQNHILEVDYILAAIGRDAANEFLNPRINSNINDFNGNTLFFAGDVKNGYCRQAVIAAGEGMKAAMHIAHYLNDGREKNI